MAKQWTELEKMVIKKGERESNSISLHPRTGTISVITIYCPEGDTYETLFVSADGKRFVPYVHRGQPMRLLSDTAVDVPVPACSAMRICDAAPQEEERVFQVLALLEVD